MQKKFSWLLSALTICAVFAQPAHSQQQPASTKPDSPEVQAHIEKAKKIAGTYWAQAEHFLCEAPRANQAPDPGPVKLFDNFWGHSRTIFGRKCRDLRASQFGRNHVDRSRPRQRR